MANKTLTDLAGQIPPVPQPGLLGDLADTWPARLARGILSGMTLPGDVLTGRTRLPSSAGLLGSVPYESSEGQASLSRITDLASLAMSGTLAGAPSGALGSGPIFRRTRGESPDNGMGYMMFANDRDSVAGYGKNLWTAEPERAAPAATVNAADAQFRQALYRALRKMDPAAQTEAVGRDINKGLARALVNEANPQNIVNSAGFWGNPALVQYAWEHVLEPRGLRAVTTNDGAVIFDPSLVTKAR